MIIKLDRERELKFTMGSLMKLERLTGKSFIGEMGKFKEEANISITLIFEFLWTALIHEDKELTLDGLADIYDNLETKPSFESIVESITHVFLTFWGNEKNVQSPKPKMPKKKKKK